MENKGELMLVNEKVTTVVEQYRKGFERNYCGVPIKISPDVGVMVAVHTKYRPLVEKAREKYAEFFEQQKDIVEFLENCPEMFKDATEELCRALTEGFIELGELEYSPKRIIEVCDACGGLRSYKMACGALESKVEEIVETYGAEVAYREQRKESRDRWTSTTYGGTAMDAWSNQMDAEMMNFVEGLGHSFVNSIGNSMSKSKMERQLKELFESKEEREKIYDGFNDGLINLVNTLYLVLCKHFECQPDPIENADMERAEAVLENLNNSEIAKMALSEEKIMQAQPFIEKVFELNPLDVRAYIVCLAMFGDEQGTLQEIGEYLCMDIVEIKLQDMDKIITQFREQRDPKKEDINELKAHYERYIQILGITGEAKDEAWKRFDEYKEEFDRIRRTYDGIEFSSYEEAVKAEEEDGQLAGIIAAIEEPKDVMDLSYEEGLHSLIDDINQKFQTSIKEKHIAVIHEKLEKFDVDYRTVEGTVYDTRQQALAKRAHLQILDITSTDQSYENVCHARQVLEEKVQEYQITQEDVRETSDYLDVLDRNCRTLRDIVFDTYELYLQGVQEDESMTQLLAGVQPPTKDSTMSYERMILGLRYQIENDYQTRAKERYLQMCDYYLADFNNKFCSVSMFKKLTREEAAQERAVMFLKAYPKPQTFDELCALREQLIHFLPELDLTLEQAWKANEWIAKQDAAIKKKQNKKGLFW